MPEENKMINDDGKKSTHGHCGHSAHFKVMLGLGAAAVTTMIASYFVPSLSWMPGTLGLIGLFLCPLMIVGMMILMKSQQQTQVVRSRSENTKDSAEGSGLL